MSDGFIMLPKALLQSSSWKSFPYTYRHVFLTILQHMAFSEIIQDDHGVKILIQPGQFLITIRRLVQICNESDIDKNVIERALARFQKVQFTRQETRHRKTMITITEPIICELIKKQIETRIETKSRQDRDTKEEYNTDKTSNTNNILSKISFSFHLGVFENIPTDDILSWKITYPNLNIHQEILRMQEFLVSSPEKNPENPRKFITSWLARNQRYLESQSKEKIWKKTKQNLNKDYSKKPLIKPSEQTSASDMLEKPLHNWRSQIGQLRESSST